MGLWSAIARFFSLTPATQLSPPDAPPVLGKQTTVDSGRQRRPPADNEIRLEQGPPSGFGKKLFWNVPVAGVSYRPMEVSVFIMGCDHAVELEREPDNVKDPNAVKVMGLWTDRKGKRQREQIGYVPRDKAAEIQPGMTIAATVRTLFKPTWSKTAGIRIDIWAPRAKPVRKKKWPARFPHVELISLLQYFRDNHARLTVQFRGKP